MVAVLAVLFGAAGPAHASSVSKKQNSWAEVQWSDPHWCMADPLVNGNPGESGTKLVLWGCQPQNAWFFWEINVFTSGPYQGWFELENEESLNGQGLLCLDDTLGQDNVRLQVYTCNGGENQAWKIANDSNGFLLLYNPRGEYVSMPFAAGNGAWIVTHVYHRPTDGYGEDWQQI